MVTLASTVIDRIAKDFHSHDTPDVLAAAMDASQTSLTYLGILPAWGIGSIVEIGSEVMLVTDVNVSTNTATVVRGWLGSTKTTHALNDPIFINPRILRSDLLILVDEAVQDMYPTLYAVGSLAINYAASDIGYDLSADVDKILRVDAGYIQSAGAWRPVYDWSKLDNQDTSVFPSGKALMVRASFGNGVPIRVTYSKAFGRVTSESTDLEADCGLKGYMTDLPYYYAMSRLLTGEEVERSRMATAQNHQRAQDVPGFLALRTGEWYLSRYNDRLQICHRRLRQETRQSIGSGYGS